VLESPAPANDVIKFAEQSNVVFSAIFSALRSIFSYYINIITLKNISTPLNCEANGN
jgi:hypothetical protein